MAAAAPPDPLDDVRTCLQVVGFAGHAQRFIDVHNITSRDNFEDMIPHEVEKIMKKCTTIVKPTSSVGKLAS